MTPVVETETLFASLLSSRFALHGLRALEMGDQDISTAKTKLPKSTGTNLREGHVRSPVDESANPGEFLLHGLSRIPLPRAQCPRGTLRRVFVPRLGTSYGLLQRFKKAPP